MSQCILAVTFLFSSDVPEHSLHLNQRLSGLGLGRGVGDIFIARDKSHRAFGAKMTSYRRRYDVILRHVPAGMAPDVNIMPEQKQQQASVPSGEGSNLREQCRPTTIQDMSGKSFTEEQEIPIRWTEYYQELCNHESCGEYAVLDGSQPERKKSRLQ